MNEQDRREHVHQLMMHYLKLRSRHLTDYAETIRRNMLLSDKTHRDLEAATERWDTQALTRDFEVHVFAAPFVVVTRKSDGVKGSLEFTHMPRWYFNFVPDQP